MDEHIKIITLRASSVNVTHYTVDQRARNVSAPECAQSKMALEESKKLLWVPSLSARVLGILLQHVTTVSGRISPNGPVLHYASSVGERRH
jgi:hypothetical protein